jgi:hypothetical protein
MRDFKPAAGKPQNLCDSPRQRFKISSRASQRHDLKYQFALSNDGANFVFKV